MSEKIKNSSLSKDTIRWSNGFWKKLIGKARLTHQDLQEWRARMQENPRLGRVQEGKLLALALDRYRDYLPESFKDPTFQAETEAWIEACRGLPAWFHLKSIRAHSHESCLSLDYWATVYLSHEHPEVSSLSAQDALGPYEDWKQGFDKITPKGGWCETEEQALHWFIQWSLWHQWLVKTAGAVKAMNGVLHQQTPHADEPALINPGVIPWFDLEQVQVLEWVQEKMGLAAHREAMKTQDVEAQENRCIFFLLSLKTLLKEKCYAPLELKADKEAKPFRYFSSGGRLPDLLKESINIIHRGVERIEENWPVLSSKNPHWTPAMWEEKRQLLHRVKAHLKEILEARSVFLSESIECSPEEGLRRLERWMPLREDRSGSVLNRVHQEKRGFHAIRQISASMGGLGDPFFYGQPHQVDERFCGELWFRCFDQWMEQTWDALPLEKKHGLLKVDPLSLELSAKGVSAGQRVLLSEELFKAFQQIEVRWPATVPLEWAKALVTQPTSEWSRYFRGFYTKEDQARLKACAQQGLLEAQWVEPNPETGLKKKPRL